VNDYELRLFVGNIPAASMVIARLSARSAKKDGVEFLSQCSEFDHAEVWRNKRHLGAIRPKRPEVLEHTAKGRSRMSGRQTQEKPARQGGPENRQAADKATAENTLSTGHSDCDDGGADNAEPDREPGEN
jgi:hypothetical protein